MSTIIPNLWPENLIPDELLTPKEILEYQAEKLAEKTHGLVLGEVISQVDGPETYHYLDLVVPELGGYRYRLLCVFHRNELPYPAQFTSGDQSSLARGLDQNELINVLKGQLQHSSTRGLLHSLAAKVGERKRATARAVRQMLDAGNGGNQPPPTPK